MRVRSWFILSSLAVLAHPILGSLADDKLLVRKCSQDKSCGFVYIVNQPENPGRALMQSAFIEMAAKSASRLRVFLPDAQIVLIMSVLPGSPPQCGPDTQAWLDVFSRVLLVPDSPYNRQVHNNECWLEKPGLLRLSPFDVTVYLDADTRIFSSGFASVLATLVRGEKDFAAVTEIATSRSQKLIEREIFNCGFFAFRQSAARVMELMARYRGLCWRNRERLAAGDLDPIEGTDPNMSKKDRIWLLANDQYAMSQIMAPRHNPLQVSVLHLDNRYNSRGKICLAGFAEGGHWIQQDGSHCNKTSTVVMQHSGYIAKTDSQVFRTRVRNYQHSVRPFDVNCSRCEFVSFDGYKNPFHN